jgi:probable HAF family extracellular repeat protein
VVGDSRTANGQTHAFITGPDGVGMTDLGTLGGNYSTARGINDVGQVVGSSFTADNGQVHVFITGPDGIGMTDLGTLGGTSGIAYGINDAGQMAGVSMTANGQFHAFITGPDGVGMTDLASVVNPPPGSTYFTGADAINNNGQLAAVAPIPEPEIYAMLLLGLGLIGFFARASNCINLNRRPWVASLSSHVSLLERIARYLVSASFLGTGSGRVQPPCFHDRRSPS